MAVNSELENIRIALPQALELLVSGGILFVITFHSTEDALVKSIYKSWEVSSLGENLNKQSISPSKKEMLSNPKSRSARLRVSIKK
jgi:16S rRNA (cytosine1402-N4)-methyltransferase